MGKSSDGSETALGGAFSYAKITDKNADVVDADDVDVVFHLAQQLLKRCQSIVPPNFSVLFSFGKMSKQGFCSMTDASSDECRVPRKYMSSSHITPFGDRTAISGKKTT